jgi:mannose/fructose/N-acetylgalactosamine-specific phosphotransferase system component IIB
VIVVSDAAAVDETQALLMRLALPEAVELEVLTIAKAARHPALAGDSSKRVLVLVPGPREVLELLDSGVCLESVNVGGLHYSAGKVQLGKATFLSQEDLEALREINRRGVRIEGRALPGDAESDILELLETQWD